MEMRPCSQELETRVARQARRTPYLPPGCWRNRGEGVNLSPSPQECGTPHLSSSQSPAGEGSTDRRGRAMPMGGIHWASGAMRYPPGSSVQANGHKDAKENVLAGMCASSVSGDQVVVAHGWGEASSVWDGMGAALPWWASEDAGTGTVREDRVISPQSRLLSFEQHFFFFKSVLRCGSSGAFIRSSFTHTHAY